MRTLGIETSTWRALALASLLLARAAAPSAAQEVSSWEYTPYRVRVWIAADDAPSLPPAIIQSLAQAIADKADVTFGAAWSVETAVAPQIGRLDMARHLGRMDVATIEAIDPQALTATGGEDLDKLLLLSVSDTADGYRLAARELDVRSRQLGRVFEQYEGNRDRLAAASSELLWQAFTPLVRIERAKGNKADVRIRAAGLMDVADCPAKVGPGAMFRPVFRRNDRKGKPIAGGLFAPPWTYLLAEGQRRTLLECRVLAGVRTPLSGRVSRRVDRFALLAVPRANSTRIVLESAEAPGKPLVGYELYAKNIDDPKPPGETAAEEKPAEKPEEPKAAETPAASGPTLPVSATAPVEETDEEGLKLTFLGLTDWRGAIDVPAGGDSPVRILYVKNGNVPLARLPCAPGVEPELTMTLRSDDLRLAAEGVVRGIQSSLMDVVCQRAVHAARIRKKIADGKHDEAQQLLDELRNMPTRQSFDVRLNDQRSRFRTADKKTQAKIDDLFKVTAELVAKYVDPNDANRLAGELRKARGAPSS